jgi:hypothetical protein
MAANLRNYSKKKFRLASKTKVFFKQSTGLALEGKLQLHRHWKVAPAHREIYGTLIQQLSGPHAALLSNNLVLLVGVFPRNGRELRDIRSYFDANSLKHFFLTKKLLSIWRRLHLPVETLPYGRGTGMKVFMLLPTDTKQLGDIFKEPIVSRYGRAIVPLLLRIGVETLPVHRFQPLERILIDGSIAIYESVSPVLNHWRNFLQRWHSKVKLVG